MNWTFKGEVQWVLFLWVDFPLKWCLHHIFAHNLPSSFIFNFFSSSTAPTLHISHPSDLFFLVSWQTATIPCPHTGHCNPVPTITLSHLGGLADLFFMYRPKTQPFMEMLSVQHEGRCIKSLGVLAGCQNNPGFWKIQWKTQWFSTPLLLVQIWIY